MRGEGWRKGQQAATNSQPFDKERVECAGQSRPWTWVSHSLRPIRRHCTAGQGCRVVARHALLADRSVPTWPAPTQCYGRCHRRSLLAIYQLHSFIPLSLHYSIRKHARKQRSTVVHLSKSDKRKKTSKERAAGYHIMSPFTDARLHGAPSSRPSRPLTLLPNYQHYSSMCWISSASIPAASQLPAAIGSNF